MSTVKIQIGLDVIRSYRRLAYTPWYALAEFIDNATQSYRDHQTTLKAAYAREGNGKPLQVFIKYSRAGDLLIISDNAMGMSYSELQRALHIGKPPANTAGRSQFGLGMKTAACWFGDKWIVRTKKLGEKHGYQVTVDVEKVASGKSALPTKKFKAPPDEHYTEIRIESLHAKLVGRKLGKTKDSLRSMYRVDIRKGELALMWDTTELPWKDETQFLDIDGQVAREDISFKVGDRKVSGWAGVLAPGFSSRSNAGFALIRRGRLIRGWPESWRPEAIFGPPPGRNDLINQRITGEIHLDNFDVTHTKDDILWQENEEDDVEEGVKERIDKLLKAAREFRHDKPPPQATKDPKVAIDALVTETGLGQRAVLAAKELEVMTSAMAPAEVAELAGGMLARAVGQDASLLDLRLWEDSIMSIFTTSKQGAELSYLTAHEVKDKLWTLVMNASHPMCGAAEDSEALRVHVQHLVADGLLMWAFAAGKVVKQPSTMLALKDAILRFMATGG